MQAGTGGPDDFGFFCSDHRSANINCFAKTPSQPHGGCPALGLGGWVFGFAFLVWPTRWMSSSFVSRTRKVRRGPFPLCFSRARTLNLPFLTGPPRFQYKRNPGPAAPQPSLRPVVPAYPSCYRLPRRRGLDSDARTNASPSCSSNFLRYHSVSTRTAIHPSLYWPPASTLPTLRDPLCPRLHRKSICFRCLRTLYLSCSSFPASRPLFSIVCALFDKNTRGCVPRRFWGALHNEAPQTPLESTLVKVCQNK
jgi:hypothetical protein